MNQFTFVGDIHGKVDWLIEYSKNKTHPIIQVGDFGMGFLREEKSNKIRKFMADNSNVRFIRGNHDNPEVCFAHPGIIKDGHIETICGLKTMFVGGALSIDKAWRTEGVSWWRDEELTYAEFQDIIDTYEKEKPDVVVTHDGPREATHYMFPWVKDSFIESTTGQGLDAMLKAHRPKYWIFGHWHHDKTLTANGTTFFCVGESSTLTFFENTDTWQWRHLSDG